MAHSLLVDPGIMDAKNMLEAVTLAKEDLSGRISRLRTKYTAYCARECEEIFGLDAPRRNTDAEFRQIKLVLGDLFGSNHCGDCQEFSRKLSKAVENQDGVYERLRQPLDLVKRHLNCIEAIETHLLKQGLPEYWSEDAYRLTPDAWSDDSE